MLENKMVIDDELFVENDTEEYLEMLLEENRNDPFAILDENGGIPLPDELK